MVDPLSGHTAASTTNGINSKRADGLRDGDALSSPTITNILQGLKGNGIIRLEDSVYGSTRNAVDTQSGSIIRATTHTMTINGGYVILDGQLYEFGGGPAGTSTITLGSDGSGTALATGEQSLYVVYLAGRGSNAQVHVAGGAPVKVTQGRYPSLPSAYLEEYDTSLGNTDNVQVVVLATVRCEYNSGGGTHKASILDINDKRHFIKNSPMYMFPLSKGPLVTDGTELSQVRRDADDGIQSAEDLRTVFASDPGKLGLVANGSTLIDAGAMWMSTSRSGGGVAATATITNTESTVQNEEITIISTNGTSRTYISKQDATGSDLHFDHDGTPTQRMTSLKTAIESAGGHNGKITLTQDAGELTLTQAVAGVDGNTTITENLSNTTKTDFSGGVSYGFGPGDGLDRGSNRGKDELFFAGQNNTETALVSKRLFTRGVSAPSAAITSNATYTITSHGDSVFILNPSATVTLKAEKSGSNYLFPEGHQIDIVNTGSGTIMFDDAAVTNDKTIAADYRASFVFEGSVWLRTAYETSSAAATSTFAGLSDTPALAAAAETFDDTLKGLRVKSDNSAIEFYNIPSASDLFPGISDTATAPELTITNTAITINEDGDVLDFRVESDDDTHMLFVDGANDRVGISQATPETTLQMNKVGFEYATGTSGTNSSSTSTPIIVNLFHLRKFRSAKLLVETENSSSPEKYEVAEIVLTTPYKSDSTISADAEMAIQVYGVTSMDSADNAPGTSVVNSYAVYADYNSGNDFDQYIQLRVTPAHSGDTVTVKVFWSAIGL